MWHTQIANPPVRPSVRPSVRLDSRSTLKFLVELLKILTLLFAAYNLKVISPEKLLQRPREKGEKEMVFLVV
jgi:hypothetical protein